ncbi:hypothetical protein [Salinicoccus roseus]|uniref:hypothetical protein n=1 Tax=Salinicoccus roseus TaxID=45670 RepID=UPI0023001FF4|nr:hypothetical protein [Salinicoccus roseus]
MKQRTKEVLIGLAILVISLLLSTPLILGNIYDDGFPPAWIAFWGSFSGGILGATGVIYVAYLQNESQKSAIKEENINQLSRLHKSEEYQRQRLFIESELNLVKEYSENLSFLKFEVETLARNTMNLYRTLLYYNNATENEKYIYLSHLEKNRKSKDYTYLFNLAFSVMNDKWVIDSLKNFSQIENTMVFNSSVEGESIRGVVLRVHDMYEMLSIDNINIEVFHENYKKYATYRTNDFGMSTIPMVDDLTRWIDAEIEHSKRVLIAETNYLRTIVDQS